MCLAQNNVNWDQVAIAPSTGIVVVDPETKDDRLLLDMLHSRKYQLLHARACVLHH